MGDDIAFRAQLKIAPAGPLRYASKEQYVAVVEDRPYVRIIVDCRESYSDPMPMAQIVAAAPALLRALKALMFHVPLYYESDDKHDRVTAAMTNATNAIAKAEGQSK